MKWVSVEARLPAIPLGMYGVPVLVAEFDQGFEEECPGGGWVVREVFYGVIGDRSGEVAKHFEGCAPTELHFCDLDGVEGLMPTSEPVYYWMYLPTPPTGVPKEDFAWM